MLTHIARIPVLFHNTLLNTLRVFSSKEDVRTGLMFFSSNKLAYGPSICANESKI